MHIPLQQSMQRSRSGLIFPLFLSHILASFITALLVFNTMRNYIITRFPSIDISPWYLSTLSWLVLSIMIGCVAGFLCTLNTQINLHLLTLALARLAAGQTVEPLSLRWRWPLRPLFVAINTLGQKTIQMHHREKQTGAYQDQLLQQVSKTAAQEERNRLARDLHDSIKQQIFSITASVKAAQMRWEHDPAGVKQALEYIQRYAQETQVEMQALLQQLRPAPLENVGLRAALLTQCEALHYRTGVQVTNSLTELPAYSDLPLGTQEEIFRIVQEAFSNIARHARASQVWLTISQRERVLHVTIRDNGSGFDLTTTQHGMGIANMHERAQLLDSELLIKSIPGEGTTLTLSVPFVDTIQLVREQHEEKTLVLLQIQRHLQLGRNAIKALTGLLLLEQLHYIFQWTLFSNELLILSMFTAVGLAAYGYIRSRLYRVWLAVDNKFDSSDLLAQRSNELNLLTQIFPFVSIVPWYLVVYRSRFPTALESEVSMGVSLLCAGLALLALLYWYQVASAYHYTLGIQAIVQQLQAWKQALSLHSVLCIGILGCIAVCYRGYLTPYFPPYNPLERDTDVLLFLLVSWSVITLFHVVQVISLQRLCKQKGA